MRTPAQLTAPLPGGRAAARVLVGAWIGLLALYLGHAIVLSSDSINNHVHVWYIARALWHHGRLPWHMPVLAHGRAYAYPYGFVNWTTAAIAWPLLGNWGVTLWTAVGAVGCLVATFVAFPELRDGWWAAAALANPAIVEALLFGQQSFAWAAMLLLFGVATWRRGHRGWATVLVAIAQITHAAIVLPITALLVAAYLPFTRERRVLLRCYAWACLAALPAVWLVLVSPTNGEIGTGARIVDFLITIGPRITVVGLPLIYTLVRRTGIRRLAPWALVVSLGFSAAFEIPLNVGAQWHALVRRHADTASLDAYLRSPQFVRGATYRVLRGDDAKLGLYKVLQAGGRLDSEMFPESMAIKSFHDVGDYAARLCDRHIDQVLHFDTYDRARRTNEHTLLDALAAGAPAPVRVRESYASRGWGAYTIDRTSCRRSVRFVAPPSS